MVRIQIYRPATKIGLPLKIAAALPGDPINYYGQPDWDEAQRRGMRITSSRVDVYGTARLLEPSNPSCSTLVLLHPVVYGTPKPGENFARTDTMLIDLHDPDLTLTVADPTLEGIPIPAESFGTITRTLSGGGSVTEPDPNWTLGTGLE